LTTPHSIIVFANFTTNHHAPKMPNLEDITYSRDETVTAIRDYYHFLTTLYLDSSTIISPPPEGWPEITTRSFTLDKSKSVISLLQHLPYIQTTSNDTLDAEGAPDCRFADWNTIFQHGSDRATIRIGTEDSCISEHIPKHVVGLTCGGMYNPRFLLDTKLGTVQWYKCPSVISDEPRYEPIQDDPYDYCSEDEEAEWRDDGEMWGISDFFEELKERFRRLEFVPLSERRVAHVWTVAEPEYGNMIEGVREIYRRYGWPDAERYRKTECLRAVEKFVEEEYPQWVA
jgi:hypothetical protein